MRAKPHVSEALRQLRRWVMLSAVLLAAAAAVHMLVFGFVAYTSVRWDDPRQTERTRELTVVGAGTSAAPSIVGGARSTTTAAAPPSEERTLSATDASLRRASTAAVTLGTLAALALAAFCFLGVIVAGGGQVPGVEKAVTACVWSFALGVLCLPWGDVFASVRLPVVFAPYAAMTGVVDGGGAGLVAHAQWVGLPLVAFVTACLVGIWFCQGVSRGVIVTAPSELDKAVEREIETIQKRGLQTGTSRTVGALNRAIGDTPAPRIDLEQVVEEAAAGARRLAGESLTATGVRSGGRSVVDEDFKRPI